METPLANDSTNKLSGKENSTITRNIILLGLVSFFADFSSEIYFAILPFFILSIGGTGLAVGIIIGVSDGFLSFLKAIFGMWSDKLARARKKFLYWGYGLPSLFKFLMAFVTTWPLLIFIRTLERVGKGVRTAPRDALITESSSPEYLGRAFGFHRAMDSFGAVIGSIFALIFIVIGVSFSNMFIISSGIALLTLIPIKLVKDEKDQSTQKSQIQVVETNETINDRVSFSEFINSGATPMYWKLVFIGVIHSVSLISYAFFLLFTETFDFSQTPFLKNRSSIEIGVMFYIIFNIVYTLTSYLAGSIADKKSKLFSLRIGFFLYVLALTSFLLAQTYLTLILSFCVLGIAYGFTQGNIRAIIAKEISSTYKATGYGVFHALAGLAILFGNITAGYIFTIEPDFAILFAEIVAIIALVALFQVKIEYSGKIPTSGKNHL